MSVNFFYTCALHLQDEGSRLQTGMWKAFCVCFLLCVAGETPKEWRENCYQVHIFNLIFSWQFAAPLFKCLLKATPDVKLTELMARVYRHHFTGLTLFIVSQHQGGQASATLPCDTIFKAQEAIERSFYFLKVIKINIFVDKNVFYLFIQFV